MAGLVHVRTPTYRRPAMLARALRSLAGQTWADWVCDVFDDDPDGGARAVVEALGDPRVRFHHNRPQRFASRNIDACFSKANPHGAAFFCVVEDDNWLFPRFMEDNVALLERHGARVVQRNQVVEHASGTPEARLGSTGVLDGLYRDGLHAEGEFRLGLLAGIGASNGGLFWRAEATDMEVGHACTATLQEYLRTYLVREPVVVALEPLAAWAENAEGTTRNAEIRAGWARRELDLKRSVQALRRRVWAQATPAQRRAALGGTLLAASDADWAGGAGKALLPLRPGTSARERARVRARGLTIRALGRTTPAFAAFLAERG